MNPVRSGNPASEAYLVALTLELAQGGPMRVGPPVYPPGLPYRPRGASGELATYEGIFAIGLPLSAGKDASGGEARLRGTLRYQSCNDRICLKPAPVAVAIPVRVGLGRAK